MPTPDQERLARIKGCYTVKGYISPGDVAWLIEQLAAAQDELEQIHRVVAGEPGDAPDMPAGDTPRQHDLEDGRY